MAKTGQRKDPHGSHRFQVEIDGVSLTSFRHCAGLKSETEVFEYQEGGDNETVHKLFGQTKAGNLTLTKGYTGDAALLKWREDFQNGDTVAEMKRRTGAVIVYDDDNKTEVARWNFEGAWPVRWEMGDLDGQGMAAIEVLEIAVARLTKSAPASGGMSGGGGGATMNAAASTGVPAAGEPPAAQAADGAASPGPHSSKGKPGKSSGLPVEHQCHDGHPVDVVTGAVVDEAVDLKLPGLIPFEWKRYYSSRRSSDGGATLGRGWAHGFEQELVVEPGNLAVRDAEGRFIYFDRLEVGATSFHRAERLELQRDSQLRYSLFSLDTRLTRVFEAELDGRRCRLRRIIDAFGNAIELHLYQGERLDKIVDSVGREVLVEWIAGRVAALRVAVDGKVLQTVRYDYSPAGCLTKVTDIAGSAETFEYDAQHRMTATTTRLGVRFQYQYNQAGRCLRTWGPDGLYDVKLIRDEKAGTTLVDGEEPRTITSNEAGQVVREVRPGGVVVGDWSYNQDGMLVSAVDGGGRRREWEYDRRGNLLLEKEPTGATTVYQYNEQDLCVREVAPDGVVTERAYEEHGALAEVRNSRGALLRYRYDARGLLIEEADAFGPTRSLSYDRYGNQISAVDANGAEQRWTYDELGRLLEETDRQGRTTKYTLDAAGNRVEEHLADGTMVRRSFNALGQVTEEFDALGQRSWFRHGGMGAVSQVVEEDGKAWGYRYTSKEKLREALNPRGERYQYLYDRAGRVSRETAFDGVSTEYQYDDAGEVSRQTYADGSWRRFKYDASGGLVLDEASDSTRLELLRDGLGRIVLATAYDKQGRPFATRFDRDEQGRVVLEQQGDREVRYRYDGDERQARVLPDGSTTEYEWASDGNLSRVVHGDREVELEHDDAGREVSRGDDVVEVEQSFDGGDRPLAQQVRRDEDEAAVEARQWHYDALGRPVRVESDGALVASYRYDALGNLVAAEGPRREEYRYDEARSLLREGWSTGEGNRLLQAGDAAFEYDARGRRVARVAATGETTLYEWDARDRLTAVDLPDGRRVEMSYDAFGRRVRREVYSAEGALERRTDFLWDGAGLAQEIEVPLGPGAEQRVRTFVAAADELTPLLQAEGDRVLMAVNDPLGVPRALLDEAGEAVWSAQMSPFGQIVKAEGEGAASPFRLLGQVGDEELGLAFTLFRVFDPETGRWLSPDPLGLEGGPDLYGFEGSPTTGVDPYGLSKKKGGPPAGQAHGPAPTARPKASSPAPKSKRKAPAHTLTAQRKPPARGASSFRGTLKGKPVTLKGVTVQKFDFVKRQDEEREALRSTFDSSVRKNFLKNAANDPSTLKNLRAAGLSEAAIRRMRAGKVPQGYQVHHRFPIDDSGTNETGNLVLIRNRPEHMVITNEQNRQTKGMKAGDSRPVQLPVPDSGVVYPRKK